MPTILVVDDSQAHILLMEKLLQQEGYRVISETNGFDALKVLAYEDIDMLLLDIMMPEMDGLALIKKMKSVPSFKELPIIIISANLEKETIEKALQLGANDYITKPFNMQTIKNKISNILYKEML